MAAQTVNFSMNVDDIFNPVYVAVASGVATCQSNTDPRSGTWTSRTMPATTNWAAVDYGNGMVVAISSTSGTIAATSVDGTNWIQRVLPTSTTWSSIKSGRITASDTFQFVAVSSAGNYAATSPDGCTWTARSITGTAYAWRSLAYGNGVWVALANSAESNTLRTATTSDGTTWANNVTTSITCPGTWSSISFGNGRFVAVCSGSTVAAYSTDGINWTATTLPASTTWSSVATNGSGVWVAVTSTSSTAAARSIDNGATWSAITFPTASTWVSVIYGKNIVGEGIFTCIGATTYSNYSLDDGLTWYNKTQITMTYTAACYAPLRWWSADTLTINNGAVVTVNTDQNRFWSGITIANGQLSVENNSTSTGIAFIMGRASGTTQPAITPSSGLGSIDIDGNWIELGTGSGLADQTMTAPYTDYISTLWVETGSETGVYEMWLNATGAYGNALKIMREGFDAIGSGRRGKFFIQTPNTTQDGPINITSGMVNNPRATRRLVVSSTTGIIEGAQIFGAGLTANSVVSEVVSSTELLLNNPTSYIGRTDWSSITYGNSLFVAVSKNYSNIGGYSSDGVTWTSMTLPFKAEWRAICYGATSALFVAVCSNSNLCATSSDGINWVSQALPSTLNWKAVASNGTSFVAVGATTADAATTVGAYSADGLTWSASVLPSAIWQCVEYGNSRYLAMSSTAVTAYDTDGSGTWTTGGTPTSTSYVGIAYNGTRFVAISGSATTCRYTTDGVTWSSGGALSNSVSRAICWTGSYFVVVSAYTTSGSSVMTSTDGASWTARSSMARNNWSGVAYGNSITVAVAGSDFGTTYYGSTAATSDATGVTWTDRQSTMIDTVPYTVFNPYRSQLTSGIVFGDGVNGNLVPTGAKVRCPNIMITDTTPANVQTSSAVLGCGMVLTNGGKVNIDTALFDESYNNFTQAQNVTLNNVGFSIPFLISECYDASLSHIGFALQPVRRYYTSAWYTRETRYGATVAWSYINNAIIQDLSVAIGSPAGQYGSAPTVASPISLSYTDSAVFDQLRFFCLNTTKTGHYAIYASAQVNNCDFTNLESYGLGPVYLSTSNNNNVPNPRFAPSMFRDKRGTSSADRFAFDSNGDRVSNNTKYYFKIRSHREFTDESKYYEGRVVSATPFLASSKYFPWKFSAYNSASATVRFDWVRRDPTASSVAVYEIFRGTSPGFTRNLASRVYTTVTSATITATDATVSNGNTYYYVLRKYYWALAGITNSSGTSGQYILTTSGNFNTGLGTLANCQGVAGSLIVTIPSGSTDVFILKCVAGMPISGGGIAAGTTIASVDGNLQITLSQAIQTSFSETTLNVGAMAGLYVSGTGVVAGTKVVSVDSDTQITVDTAFSGGVSGTITFLYGTDGPEVEVYVKGAADTAANLLLQSYDLNNASWTKTNSTPTAAAGIGPQEVPYSTGTYTVLGCSLRSTGPDGRVTQTLATLTSATSYVFSAYVRCDHRLLSTNNVVSCTMSIDTTVATTYTFNATGIWQRIEVPFTSTSTSHTFTFQINNNGQYVYVTTLQVNAGTSASAPIQTTTAAVTLNPIVQEISAAYAWGGTTADNVINQGIELTLSSAPSGTHYSDIYMGNSSDFTPSLSNYVGSTRPSQNYGYYLSISGNNIFDAITQEGVPGFNGTLLYLTGSSDNKFMNMTFDFGYSNPSTLLNISAAANNNLLHNITILKNSNYVANSFTTANNALNLIMQNVRFEHGDTPIGFNTLSTVVKGVSGANAAIPGAATTWSLGGTLDGIAIAYTAVYDTMFHELYHTSTTGGLNIAFNDSSQVTKPYTILSGNPVFSNTGRLYLQTPGDSIQIEWPNYIRGITSFRNIVPKLNGLDLGVSNDVLTSLYIEYSIDDNKLGYGSWKRLSATNLFTETITNPSIGFKIRLRITARAGMRYSAQTNPFVIGEQIRGVTSGATAYVLENYILGSTGDIVLGTIVGSFLPGELLVRHSDSATRATNVATNTNFALFPSYNSYIDGLQIFTNINQNILYPVTTPTVTITGLKTNSEIHAYVGTDPDSVVEIGAIESTTGSTFSFAHEYGGEEGYIVIMCLGYQLLRLDLTYPEEDSSIPVQQIIDRVYFNPA